MVTLSRVRVGGGAATAVPLRDGPRDQRHTVNGAEPADRAGTAGVREWTGPAERPASALAVAADVHLAGHDRAVGHRKLRRRHVTLDRSGRAQLDPLERLDVALDLAADGDRLRVEVGFDRRRGPNREAVIAELDGAVHVSLDGEVFLADDLAFDADGASNPGDHTPFAGGWQVGLGPRS